MVISKVLARGRQVKTASPSWVVPEAGLAGAGFGSAEAESFELRGEAGAVAVPDRRADRRPPVEQLADQRRHHRAVAVGRGGAGIAQIERLVLAPVPAALDVFHDRESHAPSIFL